LWNLDKDQINQYTCLLLRAGVSVLFGRGIEMQDYWVIDGHCDSICDFLEGKRSLRSSLEGGHWDLERAQEGKVILQFLAAFIDSEYKPEKSILRGLELIHSARRFVHENKEKIYLVLEQKDLPILSPPQKIALLLSVEGGEILGESLFMLDLIFDLGVRAVGLTWNQRNAIGDGVGANTRSRLTRFGVDVIKRMNELGMLIDVSHLNEAGFWHVLELTNQPILASHSCAYTLCPHPRNLTDDQLRALARNKGLVGVNFYPSFLTQNAEAYLTDVVRHIAHIAEVAGVDTVGLGSDFDGIDRTPIGLEHAGRFSRLPNELLNVGFNHQEVEQIMHKNFMRLLFSVIK
jgi:membrane dipeptidase